MTKEDLPKYLLIDKPKGITSFGVVAQIRKITGIKKIGHGGTLDPNATGLLIIGVGRSATKNLDKLINKTSKTYVAELKLGEEKSTDDPEGETTKVYKVATSPELVKIKNTLKKFVGEITQTPPIFSAIKVGGKKAYDLARKGQTPKLKERTVYIEKIKIINYSYPVLSFETKVSSGTYIRSLARDIGKSLNTGAYLNNLRRTKIGRFNIKDATKLDKLTQNNWNNFVLSEV